MLHSTEAMVQWTIYTALVTSHPLLDHTLDSTALVTSHPVQDHGVDSTELVSSSPPVLDPTVVSTALVSTTVTCTRPYSGY